MVDDGRGMVPVDENLEGIIDINSFSLSWTIFSFCPFPISFKDSNRVKSGEPVKKWT